MPEEIFNGILSDVECIWFGYGEITGFQLCIQFWRVDFAIWGIIRLISIWLWDGYCCEALKQLWNLHYICLNTLKVRNPWWKIMQMRKRREKWGKWRNWGEIGIIREINQNEKNKSKLVEYSQENYDQRQWPIVRLLYWLLGSINIVLLSDEYLQKSSCQ